MVGPAEVKRASRRPSLASGVRIRLQCTAAASADSRPPADARRFISSSPPMNLALMKTCGTVVRPDVFFRSCWTGPLRGSPMLSNSVTSRRKPRIFRSRRNVFCA